jgi:hypothetical protein
VLQQKLRNVEVAVDDGSCERHVEHTLLAWRAPLSRILLDSVLRHVRTGGVVIDIAQRRLSASAASLLRRDIAP